MEISIRAIQHQIEEEERLQREAEERARQEQAQAQQCLNWNSPAASTDTTANNGFLRFARWVKS